MKKFEFSLERMLNYNGQVLEKEKGILGKFVKERHELEDRRDELMACMSRTRRKMDEEAAAGTTVFALKTYMTILDSGRHQLEGLEAELERLRQSIERQQTVVIEASKEVKKLERLKEKKLEEYHYGEAKEQQDIISEHVAGDFVRRGVS